MTIPKTVYMPGTADIVSLTYIQLLNNAVEVDVCEPWSPLRDKQYFLATYKNDAANMVIVSAVEFKIALGMAAIFTRIPSDAVMELFRDNQITEELFENFREVMNISARFFNRDDFPHVLLDDVQLVGGPLDDKYARVINMPHSRLDVTISTTGGYGKGNMSFYKVP